MTQVELSWPELYLAASAGIMRRINGLRNHREEPYGARPDAWWNNDINGCIAELALAKHLGIFWSGTVGRIDLPDVGALQVRSKTEVDHRLVILPTDKDEAVFVSVFVATPVCRLCGWMVAKEAKRPEYLLPDPAARDRYFVPNDKLHPMAMLPVSSSR